MGDSTLMLWLSCGSQGSSFAGSTPGEGVLEAETGLGAKGPSVILGTLESKLTGAM